MKPRKSKDIQKVLEKKGFELNPAQQSHLFYYLVINGKKSSIYTYLSHGSKEYSKKLMGEVKRQLKFVDVSKMDEFFDCHMSGDEYIKMLRTENIIP